MDGIVIFFGGLGAVLLLFPDAIRRHNQEATRDAPFREFFFAGYDSPAYNHVFRLFGVVFLCVAGYRWWVELK
jgi:hypothetical protein